jgi:XTP/dITP diphosphohydrolase
MNQELRKPGKAMATLLLATRNAHKTVEIAQLLGPEFAVRDLMSQQNAPEIVECGSSFEQNAALKALTVSRCFPNELVIADDSGLEVDVLKRTPGIFSARYAGEGASDQANIEKLIRELQRLDAAKSRPRARFRCILVAARADKVLTTASGEVSGHIIATPRGVNGFGYDPIFVPDGFNETFAELRGEVKNQISHRARAAGKLVGFLKTLPPFA